MNISRFQLHNFKCLSDMEFRFSNLNILAGANGCGKSTLLQSLLLLRQSYEQTNSLDKLLLRGKYANLGMAKDLLYEYAEDNDDISYHIKGGGLFVELDYGYEAGNTMLKRKGGNTSGFEQFNLWGDSFEYLAADRVVPQTVYNSSPQESTLGIHGENAFSFLEQYGDSLLVHEAFSDGSESRSLLYHSNRWLNRFFPGFNLSLSPVIEADAVSLRYTEKSGNRNSNPHRPVNVGFGITYALPIVVALLKAKENDLILIENPEAHLHPSAQRLMGELLVRAACTGAQLIVETHSDHILNGVRICVKHGAIPHEDVNLFFFMREEANYHYHVNVYTPHLDSEGDIDIWPDGFFDEWDKALTELF